MVAATISTITLISGSVQKTIALFFMMREITKCLLILDFQPRVEPIAKRVRFCNIIDALIIRKGFWGLLYYNHNREPPK